MRRRTPDQPAAPAELQLPPGTLELAYITAAVDDMQTARDRRDKAMAAARRAGQTWRAIARAADMTENGVRAALERAGEDVDVVGEA